MLLATAQHGRIRAYEGRRPRHGAQKFEELLQRSEANVVDPRRAPVV